MTGLNVPNWNQRTSSSRKAGSAVTPPWKPPMSVAHHGMPASPMLSPAQTLLAQILPGGEDIAAPHERPVALAAHPGAADQADDVLLPARVLAFIDHARVLARVEVADLEHRPGHVAYWS